jgi:hypothetical protein
MPSKIVHKPDSNVSPPPDPKAEEPVAASSGNGADGAPIPPPDTAKAPSKFARFKVSEKIVAATGEAAVVDVKRPDNGVFFRTHPDRSLWEAVHCYERKAGGKRLYLIDPDLRTLPEIEGLTKRVMFVPYCTQFGGLGLWAISIDYDDLAWIKSALHICSEALEHWVSASSVKKQQQYRIQYASRDFGPPAWPADLTHDRLLNLAFHDSDMILDRDHDALRAARGEA